MLAFPLHGRYPMARTISLSHPTNVLPWIRPVKGWLLSVLSASGALGRLAEHGFGQVPAPVEQ